MKRKLVGPTRASNCWFTFIGLLLSGSCRGAWFVWKRLSLPHPMAILKSGRIAHFKSDKRHDFASPLLFTGRVQVFDASLFSARGAVKVIWR